MNIFTNLQNIKNIKSFSFKYSSFDGPLAISSQETFPCLIDLTNTKTSHHVSLAGVNCALPRKTHRVSRLFPNGDWFTQKTIIDKEDIERARRLKKLAEDNKDHDKAKDFFVMELQAKRKFGRNPYTFLIYPEFLYEKLSNYGRSIRLPLDRFLDVMVFFMGIYWGISYNIDNWFKAFIFSAAQMLAFIPSSRDARTSGKELFCQNIDKCQIPDWMYILTFTQSLIALILLFLLGLGMRHKFRI